LSAESGTDLATTVTNTYAAAPLDFIRSVDVMELRTAVNAVRTLANLAAFSFTDSSLASVPMKTVHVQELRQALDAARSSLALPATAYGNQPLAAGTVILATHIQELRGGVK
jgi:hypothetical protein